jgi:predicted ATPase
MKIDALRISNFRGITEVRLENLGNMVIIAGQNGSGKSCIFDAIRLLKSVYGGYQANEWQQWMGEFQINIANRTSDFALMLNDPTRELRVSCDFRLAAEERTYIQAHADELLREKIWRTILPEAYAWGGYHMAQFATQFRDREPEVVTRAKEEYDLLMKELAAPLIRGEFFIQPGDFLRIQNSIALSVAFSTFRPESIGVIDYHGAQRHYGRENVQGINLNLDATQQQRSQSALYNYGAKYTNVKGEMAASYVKEILAEAAGVPRAQQSTLTNTLKDLFATFFPEKKFLGPQPTKDGRLLFPVETLGGNRHDLDELSAGEKEILYGYLRIRNSAPHHSIILLDEPELHLNPRLIRGLPQFYQKNLGEVLGNQMWLVTHSDALLREVVGRANFNVFHMLPCGNVPKGEGQLKPLSATADLELALVDLVGDLASYRPCGKVVIFEGGGDSDFDQRVTATLFPELQQNANLISGSNKVRVRALHETLESAAQKGQLPFKFYSVTDRDSEADSTSYASVNTFKWDVYHIENYFLVAKCIHRVLGSLGGKTFQNDGELWDALRQCAEETLPQLIRHELSEIANGALVGAINTGTDPKGVDLAGLLFASIERSAVRFEDVRKGPLSKMALAEQEQKIRAKYVESLADGAWVSVFKGRDVLKRFRARYSSSVSYEVFRNLLLSAMRDEGYRPEGMKRVIEKILSS